ncbi:MAG: hypothetical protein Q8O89_06155 [Nanoarchaeota archaeon]|nr:hypothetical protein [Nanoarchaeota archaeon]
MTYKPTEKNSEPSQWINTFVRGPKPKYSVQASFKESYTTKPEETSKSIDTFIEENFEKKEEYSRELVYSK